MDLVAGRSGSARSGLTVARRNGRRGRVGLGGIKSAPMFNYADPNGLETVDAWDCQADCPVRLLDEASGETISRRGERPPSFGATPGVHEGWRRPAHADYASKPTAGYDDQGGSSRFMATFPPDGTTSRIFYTAKAPTAERITVDGDGHPTVKPLSLCRWLVRLVVPPGGTVLDMFAGSGTVGEATMLEGEGRRSILVDLDMASCRKAWIRTDPYVRRRGNVTIREGRPVEQGEEDAPRLF